jgi:hypothetical protein
MSEKILKTKTDKILVGWLLITIMIGIIGGAMILMSFVIYPHASDNPDLTEKTTWTTEKIQIAKVQSETLMSVGSSVILITLSMLLILLIVVRIFDFNSIPPSPSFFRAKE